MDKPKDYFEGTLQLRNCPQKVIDFVADEINKREKVWIAKTKKVRNGIDLLISSNTFLKQIGKKLQGKFTGEVIYSKTLFSRNRLTQKEIFRGCVLFRYHDFKKGDIIIVRGEDVKVISIGKTIFGKSLETNKKMQIKFDQLR